VFAQQEPRATCGGERQCRWLRGRTIEDQCRRRGQDGDIAGTVASPMRRRWCRPCLAVASLYVALTHAKSMGGRLVAGPRGLQDRPSAVLSDPQTTEFGVLEVAQ
jgi:hypothetical protein